MDLSSPTEDQGNCWADVEDGGGDTGDTGTMSTSGYGRSLSSESSSSGHDLDR